MIDNVVDQYIKNVSNTIFNDQMQIIPLAYLLQKDIPASVKHFFDREVENWILEEESKFESSDRFDYDIPEVRMYIDKIFDHLKNTATFTTNNFNKLLERAIKLEKDFTIKPHTTLNNFLFRDSNVIRTKEVNDTLNYFFVHNHYKEKLTEYFNLKYLHEVNSEQFKELIKQIDENIFSANMIDEALKMSKTIINFINNSEEVQDKVPADIIHLAFQDRYLDSFAELFADLHDQLLSIDDIEKILHEGGKDKVSDLPSLEEIDVSSVPAPTEDDDDDDDDDDIESGLDDDEDDDEDENSNVVEPEPVEEVSEPIVEASEPIVEATEPIAQEADQDANKKVDGHSSYSYERYNEDTADKIASVVGGSDKDADDLPDLNTLIDRKWRKKFLKKLFHKDEGFYTLFIAEINKMGSWKKASTRIEDVFYEKGVNPYSKEAIMFSDIAYQRFFPVKEY